MASYLILNLAVLVAVLIIVGPWIKHRRPSNAWFMTLVVLLVLTAIFDNVIVGLGIVEYTPSKILGLYIGLVPVEDFFYSIVAVILIPTIWNKLGATKRAK